jgi:hypothetical protein
MGLVGMAAFTAASPAFAMGGNTTTPNNVTPYEPVDADSEIVPSVMPGDNIAIACDAVQQRAVDSDVRVVLTISAVPGETPPGYKKVLATDEQLLKDAVRVRIPTVPELEDHTVNVNVYVVGEDGSQHCDAGHMKISERRISGIVVHDPLS